MSVVRVADGEDEANEIIDRYESGNFRLRDQEYQIGDGDEDRILLVFDKYEKREFGVNEK